MYLEKGIAYVSVSQVISILSSRFRANVSISIMCYTSCDEKIAVDATGRGI